MNTKKEKLKYSLISTKYLRYILNSKHSQKRLYRTDNSRLMVSQLSPFCKGLLAFHIARRYLISKIEKTTNLKKAAVAKALNRDSATKNHPSFPNKSINGNIVMASELISQVIGGRE